MSSQASNISPASPPASHGGDMDPHEVRLRQRRAQQTAASPAQSASEPVVTSLADRSHGGDMDPHAVRLRQARMQSSSGLSSPAATSITLSTNSPDVIAMPTPPQGGNTDPNDIRIRQMRMQQTPGSSPPATGRLEPNAAGASHGGIPMPQTQSQSAQYAYGASPHLAPSYPPSGYNGYQSPQSTPSAQSEQYSSASNRYHQPAQPNPAQQFPQSPQPGVPTQVGYHPPMKCSELTFEGHWELSLDEHLVSSESSITAKCSSWSILPHCQWISAFIP